MHPLDSIWAKLGQGDKYLREFNATLDRVFARKKPPATYIRQEFDQKDSSWVATIAKVDSLPLKLGLLVGDIVHNYRGALDQLVFELAFMGTNGTEIETTQFPTSKTLENFRCDTVQKRLLRGVVQKHRRMLASFQPYRGWKEPGPHPITFLDDLSNDDKHRLVQPVLASPSSVSFTVPNAGHNCHPNYARPIRATDMIGRPFEAKVELIRIPLTVTGPEPKLDVDFNGSVFVGFRNGVESTAILEKAGEWCKRIIETFASEFERPKAIRLRSLPRYGRFRPTAEFRGSLELIIEAMPSPATHGNSPSKG